MKKIVNNQKKFASLKSNQTAEITDDIKLLQEIRNIKKEFTSKDISVSYDININS
jgi:hypothetical protein